MPYPLVTASLFITSLYDEFGLINRSAASLAIKLDCGVLVDLTNVPALDQIVTTPQSIPPALLASLTVFSSVSAVVVLVSAPVLSACVSFFDSTAVPSSARLRCSHLDSDSVLPRGELRSFSGSFHACSVCLCVRMCANS